MTTEELEGLLEGAAETASLEFKGPMNWDIGIVKDILAMSNVVDGGTIVVGVDDGTFARVGLTEAQVTSFNSDIMHDQVGNYADPVVRFRVEAPEDLQGNHYVAIVVEPFLELPVICKKNNNDVHVGEIYFRSDTQRPASARVSNSNDMRDILERAIFRRRNKLVQYGWVGGVDVVATFDAELGGL
ncbi:MAG: ATP-binding protein [Cucumibacter sp.]